jgi:heme A synthase
MSKSVGPIHAFSRYAWGVLALCIGVVLWGAYVRATGSGAGCGGHWPLCNGEVVPRSPSTATLIEFTHRASSGLVFIAVLILLIWAFRAFPRRSPVRIAASLSMLFMVTEALVGAGLVLFGLVGENDSMARAWTMAFHLVNTFLLLAGLALTAWWSSEDRTPVRTSVTAGVLPLAVLLVGLLILGVSGAVAALGDTLFPAAALSESIRNDFSGQSHLLLQLRVYHPLVAFLVAVLLMANVHLAFRRPVGEGTRRLALLALAFFLVQFGLGITNLLLLAPVWLQILHLAAADLLWISTVLFASSMIRALQQLRSSTLQPARTTS